MSGSSSIIRADTRFGPLRLPVVIEIPRWGFLKRGATDRIDFVSPIPCPYNYGAIPRYLGGDGDLLDALVLGPRLRRGTRIEVRAWGAVGLTDRGMYDDKLICSRRPLKPWERRLVVWFFHCYALAKRGLNLYRGRPGVTRCEGWQDLAAAMARARPASEPRRSPIPY